nr:hypothetical protein [Tanacetum cinerariifolium]
MTLSPSSFRKRYRSSYETPSPLSSLTLLIQKRYQEDEGPSLEEEKEEEVAPEEQQRVEETPAPRSLIRATWCLDALPPTLFEGYDLDLEGLYTRSRAVKDEIFSQCYRLRSIEQERDRATKRYRGTSEPILDTEAEDDESKAEGASSGSKESKDESPDSKEEEATHEGKQQHAAPIEVTTMNRPLGLGYGTARRRTLELSEEIAPSTFETLTSPEWSSGSLPVSPSSPIVPTSVASPADSLPCLDALPPTLFEGYDLDLKELYTRTMLALKSWEGYVDAQRATMWQATYDDHRLIDDLLVHNTMIQRELQELRDSVTTLEWEGSRKGKLYYVFYLSVRAIDQFVMAGIPVRSAGHRIGVSGQVPTLELTPTYDNKGEYTSEEKEAQLYYVFYLSVRAIDQFVMAGIPVRSAGHRIGVSGQVPTLELTPTYDNKGEYTSEEKEAQS